MRITGARVFDIDHFSERDLFIEKGKISSSSSDETIVHAEGLYAIPGLVDIHFHGAAGADFCDGTVEAIETIARYEASRGIAAICPATMTYPKEKLMTIMGAAREYCRIQRASGDYPDAQKQSDCRAELVGIHLEGPFISPKKIGAQNPAYVTPADREMVEDLQRESGNLIRLITLAPEWDHNLKFIEDCSFKMNSIGGLDSQDKLHISVGHTDSDYATAKKAFSQGADHLTHLFNAMPGLQHREPGPITAGVEEGAFAEIIADGIHVHPAMVRLAFRLFGPEKMILISDSMRACGLADGVYDLGGQSVRVSGRRAVLADDPETIAGSVTDLYDCLRIAVQEMQIPLTDAVRAATYNPARSIGLDHLVGSLQVGRLGRILLVDEKLTVIRRI